MINLFKSVIIRCSLILFATLSGFAIANVPIKITGTIIAPASCVINDNQNITVNFGENLQKKMIDGMNYMKDINYILECKNLVSNNVKIKMSGQAAVFNNNYLQSSQSDLGIKITANGNLLPVNQWLDFLYPNLPKMQAVPVKNSSGVITSGSFMATATLMVEYQ